MKKVIFSTSLAAALTIAGCSNVVKDNTLKAIQLSPRAQSSTMVAELEVADKKVIGQASGKAAFKDFLEKEALADALKKVDADVLIGASFFYEYVNNRELTVNVVGYPARYKNFKPKEEEKEQNALISGTFHYEDGSKNSLSVSVKNPKPAASPISNTAVESPPMPVELPVQPEYPAAAE
ncbi:MAG: hypothetical protein LBU89_14760 [Fibromonadaceae bacterium]|jgi:hypothetical protein|nr:hypothetical protein [Fibromonadaceae bacterium]